MQYHKQIESKDGTVYSLDMVRLNFDSGLDTKQLVGYINSIAIVNTSCEVIYYPSYQQFKYRHLWEIKDLSGNDSISWSLGLDLGRNADDKSKGFIEFNPNKCENSKLFKEFMQVFNLCTVAARELVRYDMAIDIPLTRSLCKLIRKGKCGYDWKVKDDGVTEYLGQRNNHGRIKLYDKTIESKLDVPLTRLELTISKEHSASEIFPTVWLYDSIQGDFKSEMLNSLSDSQIVLVKLLRSVENPNEYLRSLNRHTKQKIEPYLSDRVLLLDEFSAFLVKEQALGYETT